MSLSFAEDADHAFFKIVTKADVDLSAGSGSTFGVLVNDISNTGQINELVCGTYTTSGGSERGYTYQWDEVWVVQDGGSDREPNIRVNNGFSGLELAFLSDYDLNIIKQDNHNFSLVKNLKNGIEYCVVYSLNNESFTNNALNIVIKDGALLNIEDMKILQVYILIH